MALARDDTFKWYAQVLRALANESRLRIVARLHEGECCVCDLVELIGSDQSTVSKHLSVLRHNAIVDCERRGNHMYYSLTTPCVLEFMSCAARVLRERGGQDR
jgi:DNA-binding transcriptional ArsR family regulator